jgi:hypothetical protein
LAARPVAGTLRQPGEAGAPLVGRTDQDGLIVNVDDRHDVYDRQNAASRGP